ncbi:MAG: hypothetical protein E6K03_09225 [Methanobacteriota archaeon]|nr:MAG: hypothetical protein E6K03_09225 [Euryarchaeota archaeon]
MLLALVSTAPEESGKSPASPKLPGRARGNPAREPSELEKFFQLNPEEKFDLEATNLIDAPKLVEEARGEKRVLRDVLRTAEALLPRVRAETEDPLLVSAILRNKTLDWVRRSPSDSSWAETMPLRWGGIFYESRVPGGRLCRKLSTRLAGLITLCVEASGAVAFLRAGVTGLFRGSAMMAKIVQFGLSSKRPRHVQQVAQAYLDDLAANRCVGKQPLPLERLSEVARRTGSAEVNITLVELFSQEGTGTLIVLDPRFHPGMDPVTIRVVAPKTQDDAATYDLVHGGVHAVRDSAVSEDTAAELATASPWERSDMTKKEWLELFKALAKRKERLGAPPRENSRDRESYSGLRDLVLADASVRRAFLAVHWKGRPSGLALLGQLLSDGTLVPEFDTDADYLEAELEHLGQGHADHRSKDGQWKLAHGWTVIREVADGNARTYRANGKSAD